MLLHWYNMKKNPLKLQLCYRFLVIFFHPYTTKIGLFSVTHFNASTSKSFSFSHFFRLILVFLLLKLFTLKIALLLVYFSSDCRLAACSCDEAVNKLSTLRFNAHASVQMFRSNNFSTKYRNKKPNEKNEQEKNRSNEWLK